MAGPLEALGLAAEHRVDILVSDMVVRDLGPRAGASAGESAPGVRTLFVSNSLSWLCW